MITAISVREKNSAANCLLLIFVRFHEQIKNNRNVFFTVTITAYAFTAKILYMITQGKRLQVKAK